MESIDKFRAVLDAARDPEEIVFSHNGIDILADDFENVLRVYDMRGSANERARNKLREHGLLPPRKDSK